MWQSVLDALPNHAMHGALCCMLAKTYVLHTTNPGVYCACIADRTGPWSRLCVNACSAYVECVNGGIFEWDTVNDELVHFFANVTGYLTASLGDDWIIAADGENNVAVLLQPQGKVQQAVLCCMSCIKQASMSC